MSSNILRAMTNIAAQDQFLLTHEEKNQNRINRLGEKLEVFVQQAFAGVFETQTELELAQQTQSIFSYVGNNSNPPDLILSGGDAIEIKKLKSLKSAISLNSSYPKSYLHSDSTLLTQACRNCETDAWQVKDMVYVIGSVKGKTLKQLWFVDGACYAANRDVYEQVFARIHGAVRETKHITFMKSREFARVIKIDPLERTVLRVRAMWEIQHPNKTFQNLINQTSTKNFQMLAILRESKYQQILRSNPKLELELDRLGIQRVHAQVLDPNNKAKLLDVRFVQYEANHA
jgi:NgoPII restriction endonuclease